MNRHAFKLLVATAIGLSASTAAWSQAGSPNCQRLEAQLTSLDRGNGDPARAERIRRAEEALNRLQNDVDRLVDQGRRNNCESSGFFSIFSQPPPQCSGINRQIGQQRSALERMQVEFEQLNGGTAERAGQRQSLLIALGENNCGAQYRSAALQGQQGGFFDRLFGPGGNNSGGLSTPSGPMGSTYRTICVRSCDGYYFPISYATTPERFRDDENACQRMCPAAEVSLYTYHNPGEEVAQAVSLNGAPYTALPNAFSYRKALTPECGCRKPGESWANALKTLGGDETLAPGDVVVTEQNAKQLSQPRTGADGKPIRRTPATASAPAQQPAPAAQAPAAAEPGKRDVRTVGPTFLPAR
jgi:TolA-binding protein